MIEIRGEEYMKKVWNYSKAEAISEAAAWHGLSVQCYHCIEITLGLLKFQYDVSCLFAAAHSIPISPLKGNIRGAH